MSDNPNLSTALRLIERDSYLRASGQNPNWGTVLKLLEQVSQNELLHNLTVQEWLNGIASAPADWWIRHHVLKVVDASIKYKCVDQAHEVFRRVMACDDEVRWRDLAPSLVSHNSPVTADIAKVLENDGLLSSNRTTWGKTVIALLGKVMIEEQKSSSATIAFRFALRKAAMGLDANEQGDEPNYDDHPDAWYYSFRNSSTVRHVLADSADRALRESLLSSNGDSFFDLASYLFEQRYAIGTSLLLLALYDQFGVADSVRDWHGDAAAMVLQHDSVQAHWSLHDARRLLRIRFIPRADTETVVRIADALRRHSTDRYSYAEELSDFQGFLKLTQSELQLLSTAQDEMSFAAPLDPREVKKIQVSWQGEKRSPDWPYPEEIAIIEDLSRPESHSSSQELSEEQSAEQLVGLQKILARPESKSSKWLGECLGWSHALITRLKAAECRRLNKTELTGVEWKAVLDSRAPWWSGQAQVALKSLKGRVPNHHKTHKTTHLSWGTNDKIMQSLSYLDELLAIKGNTFKRLRLKLAHTIARRWPAWPSFTRATTISCLRPWFWHSLPDLNSLLVDAAKTENSPIALRYVVERLVEVRPREFAECIASLLDRIEEQTENVESLGLVAQVVGASYVYHRTEGKERGDVAAVADLFRTLREQEVSDTVKSGIIEGANGQLAELTPLTIAHANAWLDLASWVFTTWRYNDETSTEYDRFPTFRLMNVFELKWPDAIASSLLKSLQPHFLTFLQKAALPEFATFHYTLDDVFGSVGRAKNTKAHEAKSGIRLTDQEMMDLCRTSAERVRSWRTAGKTTNDLGWVSSLYGSDTAMLIRTTIRKARDRGYVRRELPPVIEVLAEAKCTQTASELRLLLRDI